MMVTKGSYAYYYNAIADPFKADFKSIKSFCQQCPNGKLLEIGAGSGRILNAGIDREFILLENDDDMYALLTTKAKSYGEKVKCLQADALNTTLENDSVAGVLITLNGIAEMKPSSFILNEIHRILMTEGLLYILIQPPAKIIESNNSPLNLASHPDGDISYSVNTYATPIYGKNAFQAVMQVRQNGIEKSFVIPQVFPDYAQWLESFKVSGFKVNDVLGSYEGEPYEEGRSHLMIYTLQKETSSSYNVAQKKLHEIYEGVAPKYDEVVNKGNYQIPKWIAPHIKRFQGKENRILDLACGNGYLSKFLYDQGVKGFFFGIDFSHQMLACAAKLGIFKGLLQADLSKSIPIQEDRLFDLIMACGVMEFISSPVDVLKDVTRLLAPGGEAFISFEETCPDSMPCGMLDEKFGFIKYNYDFETIKGFVKASGLTIISDRKGIGYTSPSTHQDVPYILLRLKRCVNVE